MLFWRNVRATVTLLRVQPAGLWKRNVTQDNIKVKNSREANERRKHTMHNDSAAVMFWFTFEPVYCEECSLDGVEL